MRRLLGFIRNLPGEAVIWSRMRAIQPPVTEPQPEKPKKVDYDALRALGGNIITIPKKATG